jgi:hypothetical protein
MFIQHLFLPFTGNMQMIKAGMAPALWSLTSNVGDREELKTPVSGAMTIRVQWETEIAIGTLY